MSRDRLRQAAPYLMAVALASSPAYVIRPRLGPLPTTLLEIVLVVAIAVGGYSYWDRLPWRNPFTWAALLLLAGATVGTALAPSIPKAAGIWKAYFVEPVLAGLVIAALATSPRNARLLLAGLGVGGAAAALANLGRSVAALASHSFDYVTPPVAIYNSANDVPLYLVPLAAMALALVLYSEARPDRILAAGFLVLALAAVGLSFSRSGWAALAITLVVVSLFSSLRYWVIGAAVAVAGAGFGGSHRIRERVLVEFDPSSPKNTINLRLSLWRSAVNLLEHRPLTGGGLSGFQKSVTPYADPTYHEQLIYPHDLVLNFWSETGLLGLAGFLWILGVALMACRRALGAGSWPRLIAIGVLGMLVDYLIHGLTDVPYFKNDLALEFWSLLGILVGACRSTPIIEGH